MITVIVKQGRLKCIKCTCKSDKLYDVSTHYNKVFKYDPFWHQIKGICHVQLENNLVGVKVQGAPYAMDYCFIIALNCNSELVWGEICYNGIMELKA